jgi:hypothetical protein
VLHKELAFPRLARKGRHPFRRSWSSPDRACISYLRCKQRDLPRVPQSSSERLLSPTGS